LMDPTKRVIDLEGMKRLFIKKKIHDEAVTKVIKPFFNLKFLFFFNLFI
jgi:hypothetical protein